MSRRQEIQAKAAADARRDRTRLIRAVVGLLLCLAVLYVLTIKKHQETEDLAQSQQEVVTDLEASLPKADLSKLKEVRDSTEQEQVILEPEAYAELARLGRSLFGSWLYLMGEPAFPFDGTPAEHAELRAKPFRIRATLLDGQLLRRSVSSPEEYWCLLRTDDGKLLHYVALNPPEELFGNENYVLADGYYFKQYRRRVDGEWVSAPLFVGRVLAPSYRKAPPLHEPDPEVLAKVQDQPMGTNNDPRLLDQEPGLWHLLNVAATVSADEAALKAAQDQATVLDYDTLSLLVKTPELYRGRMFELGGMVREAATTRTEENPLRLREMGSAWIRNDALGDTLLHLKAPGEFDFLAGHGPVVYHGYFLMLWAYLDTKNHPRRVPVFVVTDAALPEVPTPAFATHMAMIFIGIAVALGLLMFVVVQRDRKRNAAAMEALLQKRAARRQPKP